MVDRSWDDMTNKEKVALLRAEAERLRAIDSRLPVNAFFTVGQFIAALEAAAHRMEGIHDEQESPEPLAAEAEVSRQMADLLKRHDAGSLNALIKRHTK